MSGLRVLALALLASTSPATAQEAGEIVVTAPGGAIDMDEARNLDAAAVDASGRPDLARALERSVPGLTLAEASGNAWQAAITWRGFSVSALQGAEQGMAVYLDGVRFNQPFGDVVLLDLLPDAALVSAQVNEANPVLGRNALAGSLLLQTGDGTSLPGLRASFDIDTEGSKGGTVSLGLADDSGDLLLLADVRDEPGWRVASPSRLYRGFAKGRHKGDGWGLEFSVLGASTQLTGNGVAPVELLDADWHAVFTRPDTTETRFIRLVAAPYIEAGENGRVELRGYLQDMTRRSANGDLADFGACDDDAAFLCVGDEDEGYTDPLFSGVSRVASDDDDEPAVFNRGEEQTRAWGATLQWLDERETAKGPRRIALGVSWERAATRFGAMSELGRLEADRSVTALHLPLVSAGGAITPVDVGTRLTDHALFASAELPLTRALSVEAGARYSHNHVELDDRIGTALDGRHRFEALNPSVEFDYALGGAVHATGGFSLTSRNPTPAELSCADPQAPCTLANFFIADPPLKQVKARNWNAGISGEGSHFGWRLNAWRADTRDDIRMIASQFRGRAYFANLGHTRRQGVEASADWRRGHFRVSASYAFTDARFRDGFVMSSPQNPAADEDGVIAVAAGDQLPGVPRHAVNLRLAREAADWSLGLAMRARSGQFLFGDEGNDNARTGAYAVFDLDGRVRLSERFELVAQLRNLLDRRYGTFGTFAEVDDIYLAEAPGAENPRALAPGAPRRLTVSLRARF
ncbi:MAG: TonB-dependent receptor [Novosphingobium sp.]